MSSLSALSRSSGEIRTDYLNLMITQLRNQNPLDPMDNADMTAQLAQLSQLEQLETVNESFEAALLASQRAEAANLIGKQVSFFPPEATEAVAGEVEQVSVSDEGVVLHVGTHRVSLDALQTITN